MKEFKPIAMRCNQQQYDEIKQILLDNNCRLTELNGTFDEYQYLVNNQGGKQKTIFNLKFTFTKDYNRTVFEIWNKDTFLEYCGIKTENNWVPKVGDWVIRTKNGNPINKVTKDKAYKVIKIEGYALYVKDDADVEDLFDLEYFRKAEPHEIPNQNNKTDFIVGKWYKINSGNQPLHLEEKGWYCKFKNYQSNSIKCLEYIHNKELISNGNFNNNGSHKFTLLTDLSEIQQYLPDNHPDKIVKQPDLNELLEYAKKYYPIGTKHSGFKGNNVYIVNSSDLYFENGNIYDKTRQGCIYNLKNNKWAEIVEPVKLVEIKSKYQIAAEEALEKFKDIQIGDEYITMFGKKETAGKLPEIIGNGEDCCIDCGRGYLWKYDNPDKFGYKINKQNNIRTDAYREPKHPLHKYQSTKQIQPIQLIIKKKIVMDTKINPTQSINTNLKIKK